ncbi:hypothetical protein KDC22_25190 [Paenibacillus tritici]|uniref:hypothetical protein n=1 Tax=Paenibacillus tritici TaxID=1873425 RepID=UPI001BAC533E|nr:hypothetical protein [Paenibacillus tritici]QUL53632.1 hypothetical protein KDC22_25190 [Paenibacillus tritici]
MSSLIYLVVIAVIAIITNWNKNKGKSAPRGGMPTFGGGGEGNPLRRPRTPARTADSGRPEQPGSGFPAPAGGRAASGRPEPEQEAQESGATPEWPGQAARPAPDYETGEGVSLEQAGTQDGVEVRIARMQEELERMQAAFDGMAAAVPSADSDAAEAYGNADPAALARHPLTGDREALRSGLMWAEVLGPPRARLPHSTRR